MTILNSVDPNLKECHKCGEIKEVTDFHARKDSPDGLCSQCKVCRMNYQWEYRRRPYVRERDNKNRRVKYRLQRIFDPAKSIYYNEVFQ